MTTITLQPMKQQVGLRDTDRDWTGVTSSAERRRMQNRLNQRRYYDRNKQRKARKHPKEDDTKSLTAKSQDDYIHNLETRLLTRICFLNHVESHERIRVLAREAMDKYAMQSQDLRLLSPLIRLNVFTAWQKNADILGLRDGWLVEMESPVCQLARDGLTSSDHLRHLPPSLRPTATQLMVPHHPWVDVLPDPQLRDNILNALHHDSGISGRSTRISARLDEWDLCHDLIEVISNNGEVEGSSNGESHNAPTPQALHGVHKAPLLEFERWSTTRRPSLLIWSDEPWEVQGWEASSEFAQKWGWLLRGCTSLLEATNVWRRKRGDIPLYW